METGRKTRQDGGIGRREKGEGKHGKGKKEKETRNVGLFECGNENAAEWQNVNNPQCSEAELGDDEKLHNRSPEWG